jgi:DNA-binding NtrC family response regulator
VEDEKGLLSLVQRVLERAGYSVVAHDSPAEALAWWADDQHRDVVDLVLTDVVMPGMSGPQMASRMRESRPSVAVLLMSGQTIEGGISHPYPLLEKPYTHARLLDAVREVLSRRSGAA